MSIYHFSVKLISRSGGRSAIAAAAYRSASELHDERLGQRYDYTGKTGVVHSEILLPDGAPARLMDRATLWNEVEAERGAQGRAACPRGGVRDSPRAAAGRGYPAGAGFCARAVRGARDGGGPERALGLRRDGEAKPHAHVMLATRTVGPEGFGQKAREWNRTEMLTDWRARWAELANERLAELGHDLRIDHRSNEAQGIALEPQNKIGPAGARRADRGEQAERAAEHAEIARRNGERIIAEPETLLTAITHQQSTFTRQDLARMVNRHTVDAEQFAAALAKVEASPALVRVGVDDRGRERLSTREMLAVEQRLETASLDLAKRAGHAVGAAAQARALAGAERTLEGEQLAAFQHVTAAPDVSAVIGFAGTGKSTMLGAARAAWENAGYRVRGAALSGIAAEGLETGAGIQSRTLASLEYGWARERDQLTGKDVLVVDEAGMIGSRQLERVASAVQAGRSETGAGGRSRAAAGDRGGGGVPRGGRAGRRGGADRDSPAARGMAAGGDAGAGDRAHGGCAGALRDGRDGAPARHPGGGAIRAGGGVGCGAAAESGGEPDHADAPAGGRAGAERAGARDCGGRPASWGLTMRWRPAAASGSSPRATGSTS